MIRQTASAPPEKSPRVSAQSLASSYARIALGAAFLSGIASRFGLYGRNKGYGNFANFVQYTGQVTSFMPASTIPFLAWSATVAEAALGVLLIIGLWTRLTAMASASLLAIFGIAMAVSMGIKSPLDYSVFSASAAALLLAFQSSGNMDYGKGKEHA